MTSWNNKLSVCVFVTACETYSSFAKITLRALLYPIYSTPFVLIYKVGLFLLTVSYQY